MLADLARARQAFLDSAEDPLLPIVDAHHHFWAVPANPHPWLTQLPRIPFRYGDYSAICRDFLPVDYTQACAGHRVLRHVVMEGEWDPADPVGEALWMVGLAQASGRPHAMAAQAWLDRDDVAEVLVRYSQPPLAGFVRSVRHKPRVLPRAEHHSGWSAPGTMRCPRWRDGYALLQRHGLMFELQAPWWHMDEAVELARDFPATRIVVNHAGLPAARNDETLRPWRAAMARLADCPNVRVKLSGLGVAGQPWSVAQQRPVVEALIDDFGPQRCMFASNFPVDGLVVGLDDLWSGFKTLTQGLSPADRLALFCDTALDTYGLQ
ncbi:amidohydrolase family protein [Hydrogenophaga sp. OTU3427]|uniref:amidohydrolase family protein n=1 Tax=Hydrogenophaga sp. OTU3427 TaxID=3043856 RepID=UPI00313CD631